MRIRESYGCQCRPDLSWVLVLQSRFSVVSFATVEPPVPCVAQVLPLYVINFACPSLAFVLKETDPVLIACPLHENRVLLCFSHARKGALQIVNR
jgi:hypothetical protein